MRSKNSMLFVFLGAAAGACSSAAIPIGVHPNAGAKNAAGVSLGVLHANEFQSAGNIAVTQIPYGEGVFRKKIESGQLEVRGSGSMGYLGINFESVSDSTLSAMIDLGVGASYLRESAPVDGSESQGALSLAPTATIVVMWNETYYLAPRTSYAWQTRSGPNRTAPDFYALGLAAGIIHEARPFSYTFEVSALHLASVGGDASDDQAWIIMPSVGFQLVSD